MNQDCPFVRKILGFNLLIFCLFFIYGLWSRMYFSFDRIMLLFEACILLFLTITGAILYLRPFPRNTNRDENFIIYFSVVITSVTIIKWFVFWYWGIDPITLPVKYDRWIWKFEFVSYGVAGGSAYLPFIIWGKEKGGLSGRVKPQTDQ